MSDKRPSPRRHRFRSPTKAVPTQAKKFAKIPSRESIPESTSTTDSVRGSRTFSQEKLAGFSESSFVSAASAGVNEIISDAVRNSNNNATVASPGDNPSSVDWNPTISNDEMYPVGEPCCKPKDSLTMDAEEKTIEQNLRIVSSNIRRKKMIIWILVFFLGMTSEGILDLLLAILKEKTEVFSMNLIKPYILPLLAFEFGMGIIGIAFIAFKLGNIGNDRVNKAFRIATVFNTLQYLLLMLLLPLGLWLFNTQLATDMQQELAVALNNQENSRIWMSTQSYRQCCGISNRTDWIMPNERNLDREKLLKGMLYPDSCCKDFNNLASSLNTTDGKGACTELSKNFWTEGCRRAEFLSMLDYILWFIGYIFSAFILTVFIKLWTEKLERYMVVFRPREVF